MFISQQSSPQQPSEATPLPSFVSRQLTFKTKTGILQATCPGAASRADPSNWKQRRDGRTRERRRLRCLEAFPSAGRLQTGLFARCRANKRGEASVRKNPPPPQKKEHNYLVNVEKQTDERCENERWSGDRQGAVEGFSLGILL